MYSLSEILDMDPINLAYSMAEAYYIDIPTQIDDIESMEKAGIMLGDLTNKYSYLLSLLVVLKVYVRQAKKEKEKEKYEELIAKRDTIQDVADMVKQQYNAISRMISTKSEINREINMQ